MTILMKSNKINDKTVKISVFQPGKQAISYNNLVIGPRIHFGLLEDGDKRNLMSPGVV